MSSVSFLGAASGLPLEELVSTFVQTERDVKLGRINTTKNTLDASLSGVGQLKSALAAFQESIKKLSSEALASRKTTILQPNDLKTYIESTANNNASSAEFDVKVLQMAKGSRLESADGEFTSSDQVVSTSDTEMTFTAGDNTFTISITAGTTLSQLRENINNAPGNFGINANIINAGGAVGSKMVLSSKVTGDSNNMSVTASNAELSSLTTGLVSRQNAQDAIIEIDGISARNSSNTFSDVVQDVSITVKNEMLPTESAKLSIATDTSAVKENINNFIQKYNELVEKVGALTKSRTIGDDGKTITAEGGALAGDSLPRTVLTQLRSILGSSMTDASSDFPDLFSVGISLDKTGKLELNTPDINGETGSARFERVLENNFDAISNLFSGDNGLSKKLDDFVNNFNKSDGVISNREKSLQSQLKNNAKALESANRYITQYEDTLRKRFQGLDSLLARLQNTSASVSAQLANLPGFSTQKS